jgi:hypothetical protein
MDKTAPRGNIPTLPGTIVAPLPAVPPAIWLPHPLLCQTIDYKSSLSLGACSTPAKAATTARRSSRNRSVRHFTGMSN